MPFQPCQVICQVNRPDGHQSASAHAATEPPATPCCTWVDGQQTSPPFDNHAAAEAFRAAVKAHGAPRVMDMHGPIPRLVANLRRERWIVIWVRRRAPDANVEK